MQKNSLLILLILLATFLSSCKEKRKTPDIGNIRVDLKVLRFEHDLFDTDFEKIADSISFFKKKYGEFFEIFNYKIIKIGSYQNPAYPELLKSFVTDYNINQVRKSVNISFKNIDTIKMKLIDAFKYFRFYFPHQPMPIIITYISGFNQSIVTSDTILGISLDKYLGSKCEFYRRLGLPYYMHYNMNKDRIPVDCIRAWGMTQFSLNDSATNLLANMIYQGKIIYFTKTLLPSEPDSLIIGMTKSQLIWCKKYEESMWTTMVENKLLFKSDYFTINKFIGEGPFTKDFGRKSPAKAAVWLGWRIINAYMDRHPEINLQQLMKDNDFFKILRLSKYKP